MPQGAVDWKPEPIVGKAVASILAEFKVDAQPHLLASAVLACWLAPFTGLAASTLDRTMKVLTGLLKSALVCLDAWAASQPAAPVTAMLHTQLRGKKRARTGAPNPRLRVEAFSVLHTHGGQVVSRIV